MEVFRAVEGVEVIREGDGGDFMLIVVEGRIEVRKQDRWNTPQLIAAIEPGRVLGEMSMIDGEPRFATCVAAQPTLVAVLDRAEPGAHHRRAAAARRQDPDGTGADAVAAAARHQQPPDGAARRAGAARRRPAVRAGGAARPIPREALPTPRPRRHRRPGGCVLRLRRPPLPDPRGAARAAGRDPGVLRGASLADGARLLPRLRGGHGTLAAGRRGADALRRRDLRPRCGAR